MEMEVFIYRKTSARLLVVYGDHDVLLQSDSATWRYNLNLEFGIKFVSLTRLCLG